MADGEVIIEGPIPQPEEEIKKVLERTTNHTIILKGSFDFGHAGSRKTVTIERGITIKADPTVGAKVIGGG